MHSHGGPWERETECRDLFPIIRGQNLGAPINR